MERDHNFSPLVAYLKQTTALQSTLAHLVPLPARMPIPVGLSIEIDEASHG